MSFGLLTGNLFPSEYLGIALSLGMLIGEVVGVAIKKNKWVLNIN